MKPRTLVLELDELDWDVIQNELAQRQAERDADGMYSIPDGDSNLAGAVLAECIRDLNEYRDLYQQEHP